MKAVLAIILMALFLPSSAAATQGHGGPEGLYAHQMAHLFFSFAMGLLIFWLRKRRLIVQAGWRLIQYAALFFLLWNLDAFTVHFLEEQLGSLAISQSERWHIRIETPAHLSWLAIVYYVVKLDHLICVPAAVFLFMGLRKLITAVPEGPSGEETP